MKINGKEYEINLDVKFGIIRKSLKYPNDPEIMVDFIKGVLKPSPSDDEIDEMSYSQISEIGLEVQDFFESKQSENKKKLSQ